MFNIKTLTNIITIIIIKNIKRSVTTMSKQKDENEIQIIVGKSEKRNDIVQPFITNYLNQFEEGTGSFHYDEKKQTITMSGRQNGYHVTMTAEKGLGETTTQTSYPVFDRKSDYREEVLRLYNEVGIKQKEIALRLNISQSLVSKLINDNK